MPPPLMNVREVADYLRLKERKVYDLVARRAIPCTRVSGKWLFPRNLIDAWLAQNMEGAAGLAAPLPSILAGSHDPLLEWALRESGAGLALLLEGSISGVDRVAARHAVAAGLHLIDPETGGYNVDFVQSRIGSEPVVLIEWARREQGLILPQGNPRGVAGITDLPRLRLAVRQKEAGSYVLLHHLLQRAGLAPSVLLTAGPPLRSETDVALAVSDGRAEAGLGIAVVAHQLRLDFLPLCRERFDLLIWRRAFFDEPVQKLLAFARSPALAERARAMAGYDVSGLGTIHFNGPGR